MTTLVLKSRRSALVVAPTSPFVLLGWSIWLGTHTGRWWATVQCCPGRLLEAANLPELAVAISAEARRLAASGLVPTDHVTQLDRRLTQVVATIDTMRLPAVPPLPHRIPGALPGPRPVIDVRRPHSPGLLRRVERGIEKKPAAA